MKKIIRFLAFVITLMIVNVIYSGQTFAQQNDINYQEFYNQLSPYGQWVDNPDYGYVWIPDVSSDFSPYSTNGYWVLTDYGWTWVSDYNWGWITFHYGRWDFNNYYGWYWVPDNEWGPSWVTWRSSEGYYGWAPMRPGISVNVSFGSYNNASDDHWIFVRDRDFERHDIGRYQVDRKNNLTIINNSTVINKTYFDNKRNTTFVTGPSRGDVQKVTGRTIRPVIIRENNKPGQTLRNNQLQIYMPRVQKNNTGHKLAPARISNVKDVKRITVREAGKQPLKNQVLDGKFNNGQRQPAVNQPNKINNRVNNNTQQKNATPDNNINKERQQSANQVNKVNSRNQTIQPHRLDPAKKINKAVQPAKLNRTNQPISNNRNNIPNKNRVLDPQRQVRPSNPPSHQQVKNISPKARPSKAPQKNNVNRPAKPDPKSDKNVIKNP